MADSEIREVYSAANVQEAYLIKTMLEEAGIEARVVGDHLQNAVGDLPVVAISPRVWVHALLYGKARKLIDQQLARRYSTAKPFPKWRCAACGERNVESFDICWNCQASRDA